jgi:hypothetical protein
MFEKEAEEWVKENMDCCKTDNSVNQSIPYFDEEERCCAKSAFQDGAEFGYNKGKEEVEQWHILAENPKDVPAENSVVKVLTEDNIIQESTYFYDDYFEEMAFSNVGLVKVLAWKEIVLPKGE